MQSDIDIVKSIIDKNPKRYSHILKTKYTDIFNRINSISSDNFKCKVATFIGLIPANCLVCNRPTKLINVVSGYRQFCSVKCMSIHGSTLHKKQNTLLKNYKVSSPLQSASIRIKFIKSMKSRYGVDNALQSPTLLKKQKQTTHNRYGTKKEYILKQVETARRNFYDALVGERIGGHTIAFTLDEYTNITSKYPFICRDCNKTFIASLDNGNIPRCSYCYPVSVPGQSSAELELMSWLSSKSIDCNHRMKLNGVEFDIVIPDKKLAIEYDGLYWHSQWFKSGRQYHRAKTQHAEACGYQLIHIFEDEWVHKKKIVESRLLYKLGQLKSDFGARECTVVDIDSNSAKQFFDEHHLQSGIYSKYNIGLVHADELLSVMSFSPTRRVVGVQSGWELTRFASKYNIPGAATRLFKRATADIPTPIISYADYRWSSLLAPRVIYTTLGFQYCGLTSPNYWYINGSNIMRHHRYKFRKAALQSQLSIFDPQLSEYENMCNNGYTRIWDCGSLKYIYK